jgi:hypothetical protein
MKTVKLAECLEYTEADFRELLETEQPVLIDIEIQSDFYNPEAEINCGDFIRAAYVGQLLKRISEEFFYTLVNPGDKVPFSFIINTHKWQELASILFRIMMAYADDEYSLDFDIAASRLLEDMDNTEEIACMVYIEMIASYD